MLKRIMVFAMLFVMLFSVSVYGFNDIKDTDWYYKDIKGLKDNNVIMGYTDGSFRPQSDITNAETLTMLLRATNIEIEQTDTGHWATGALLTSSSEGIVEDITTFYYDDKATRGIVAEWLVKALKLELTGSESNFKDTDNKYAVALYDEGLIQGVIVKGERLYNPDKPITRAEIGTIVSRVMVYNEGREAFKVQEINNREEKAIELEEELAQKELEEKLNKSIVKLVEPLHKSEYDISGSTFRTQDDFKKLFVYMGYNNLTTYNLRIDGITATDIKEESFKNAIKIGFKEVFGKYPEYYSTANGLSYKGTGHTNYVELEIIIRNDDISEENIKFYRSEFLNLADKKLEELIAKGYLTNDMTQYDMAKYLYEWVVQNTKYDNDFSTIGYTGYGQIKNGLAVCQGYTATYNYMLRRLGIDAYGISGHAGVANQKPVAHIWTIAYLDGIRYHIDTTWGDAYDTTSGKIDYNYFGTNGPTLSKTHSWNTEMFGE